MLKTFHSLKMFRMQTFSRGLALIFSKTFEKEITKNSKYAGVKVLRANFK